MDQTTSVYVSNAISARSIFSLQLREPKNNFIFNFNFADKMKFL